MTIIKHSCFFADDSVNHCCLLSLAFSHSILHPDRLEPISADSAAAKYIHAFVVCTLCARSCTGMKEKARGLKWSQLKCGRKWDLYSKKGKF